MRLFDHRLAGSIAAATLLFGASAMAEPLAMNDPFPFPSSLFEQVAPEPDQAQPDVNATDDAAVVPDQFRRQIVGYDTREQPGTIVIDTSHTYLYYVLGGGRAIRYGIGVGRDGFRWAGVQTIANKQEWPDWHPPEAMIERQPYLPRMMAGGPGNPLGARAMYLGNTEYRIHGTNDPSTIGKRVSSGCIRLTNEDVGDLYNRAMIGTKVVVLPDGTHASASPMRSAPRQHVSQVTSDVPRPAANVPNQGRPLMLSSGARQY